MSGFVCIYYGNTGSSWLLDALGDSPQVWVPGFEPVEAWAWKAPADERLAWVRTALTPPAAREGPEFEAWVEALAASPQVKGDCDKPGFELVGFKLNDLAVFSTEPLVGILAETDARVIVLVRENRIKHALSLYRYHEEGKSQFDGRRERPRSRVKLGVFDRWLRESTRLHSEAERVRAVCLERLGSERVTTVAYEEFVDDDGKRRVLDRLCAFLGIDRVGQGRFGKATPDDLRAAVINHRMLRLRYALTPYRRFFS